MVGACSALGNKVSRSIVSNRSRTAMIASCNVASQHSREQQGGLLPTTVNTITCSRRDVSPVQLRKLS